MADRRVRVGRACGRFDRIFTAVAVDVIEPLRFGVIRLYIFITDRPGRREAAVMANLAEVFFTKAEQRGTVEFRIAADVIVGMGMELFAVLVMPHLLGLVFPFEVYRAWIPVVFLSWYVAAAFKKKNPFPCRRKLMGQGAAAGAGADNDHIEMGLRVHVLSYSRKDGCLGSAY